jgi:HK97 family phage major capsid protein
MVFATTTTGATAILPEQVAQLIDLPVAAQSVAFQVSTLIETGSTTTRFPMLTDDPSAAWTAEGDEISPSDPTTDDLEVTPLKIAGLTVITNEMAADSSPAGAELIGAGVSRDIARKIDAAYFGTAGASTTQPQGLGDLTAPAAVDAGATWANLDPFEEAKLNAETLGVAVTAFVANPADALILAQLKESTGSNKNLLQPDPTQPTRRTIGGVQLFVSPAVTEGTVWGIPRERSLLVRRTGTTLEVDRSAYFTSDRTAIRATSRVGFGFPQAAAVQKITLGA